MVWIFRSILPHISFLPQFLHEVLMRLFDPNLMFGVIDERNRWILTLFNDYLLAFIILA